MLFEKLTTTVVLDDLTVARQREVTISCRALEHGFATLHITGDLKTLDYKKEKARVYGNLA